MGMAAWLDMEGKDVVAFMFAGLLGYLAATLVPAGAWAIYASILVSYHLFLGWLVATAEHKTGVSLPIASTILTHLACLALILTLGMGRHVVPFFGIFRYGIAALAIFERPRSSSPVATTTRIGSSISPSKNPPRASSEPRSNRSTSSGCSLAPRTGPQSLRTMGTQAGDRAIARRSVGSRTNNIRAEAPPRFGGSGKG